MTHVHSQGPTQLPLAGPPLGFLGPGLPVSRPFLHFEGPLSWELKLCEPFLSPARQLYPISPEGGVSPAAAEDEDLEGLSLSAASNPDELCAFGRVISPP